MDWKNNFKKNKEIVVATTTSRGRPHMNVVVSLGVFDNKILVANCQMETTIKNIIKNKNVCLLGGYYRVKGTARVLSSGKYFDICVRENKKYRVKNAILIVVEEIFNLDSGEAITIA